MDTDNIKKFSVTLETTGTKQQCKITVYHYNKFLVEHTVNSLFPDYNVVDCQEEEIKCE